MKYLLSVVIPTKNRQKYCIEAVRQIISLDLERTQIVIQDNSDEDSLKAFLEGLNCDNVKYNFHAGTLSFIDNFNEGVELAEGEYICMIGDDDGVLPNIIDVVKMAKNHGYDAVVPGLNAVYFWPTEHSIVKDGENGYLCLSYLYNHHRNIDCKKGLSCLMKQAGQDYQKTDVPRLYHGIVNRECVHAVKTEIGTYFDGLTPDIYMAVALCFTCSKVCKLDYPVTISGICPRSGSADSATGRHTGQLKDAPHFIGHDEYEWDLKAPAIYSVESIWAETVLHALKDFSADEYYDSFRIDVLDGICLNKYPQFADEIKQHASTFQIPIIRMKYSYKLHKFKQIAIKCYRRIMRKKRDVVRYYNIPDISRASSIIKKELNERGIFI